MALSDQVIQKRRQDIKKVQARKQAEKEANKVLKKKLTTIIPQKFVKTAGIAQKNERLLFDDMMKLSPEQCTIYPSKHIFITRINQTFKTTQFIENILDQLRLKQTGDAIFIGNNQQNYQFSFGYFTSTEQIEGVISKYGLIDDKQITNNNIVEQKYNGEILSIGEIAQMIFDGECKDVNSGITFKIGNDKINNPINQKKNNQLQGDLGENIYQFI